MKLDKSIPFHATPGKNPSGRIFLSPISVQEYIDRQENIPVDIFFAGKYPCISFQVGNASLAGDVPLSTVDIQKEIYEHGQRYIRKWDLKLGTQKLQAQNKLWLGISALLLLLVLGLVIGLMVMKSKIPKPSPF